MTRALGTRLAKIETQRGGPAAYFVEVPADAWDYGDVHLERATQEAVHAHQVRTGYLGPVLVGPPVCVTEEEWSQRHNPAFGQV